MPSVPGWLAYLSLILAFAFCFWQGARFSARRQQTTSAVDQHYLKGLNFLLNEQSDEAIDTFVRALEVNASTLETHLSLGNLLRRRGEVDRAIKIHQNLLARPNLTVEQQHQAEYELAVDFIKLGLFDRAEKILSVLIERDGVFREKSLHRLLELHQAQGDWQQGLDVIQSLQGTRLKAAEFQSLRAHFCCELAKSCFESGDLERTKTFVKQAILYDRNSLRANLMACEYGAKTNLRKALASLKKVLIDNPVYIDVALPVIAASYRSLADEKSYRHFLETFYAQFESVGVLSALAVQIEKEEDAFAAAKYVSDQVQKKPSLKGVDLLLDYYLEFSKGGTREHLQSLKQVLQEVLSNIKPYKCQSCGFKSEELHWLCPTCKTWDSIQPY